MVTMKDDFDDSLCDATVYGSTIVMLNVCICVIGVLPHCLLGSVFS